MSSLFSFSVAAFEAKISRLEGVRKMDPLGDIVVTRVQNHTSLPCKIGESREPIKNNQIYIAPPDTHMLVTGNEIIIGHGPPQNRFRPSIDVLFTSAAISHGKKTIGIILTGFWSDGTIGMAAIKESGGYCIHDPNEAEYPDIPMAVLEAMEVDDVLSLQNMGDSIFGITKDGKLGSS
jgi:two-component system chemotaxis response regulator CheB